jgi:hypothetical protein
VIFGSQIGLHSLSVFSASSVDVLAGLVSSDEGDCFNVLVVEDSIDSLLRSVNQVDDSGRQASFFEELDQEVAGACDLLRGLHDVGVAAGGSHGVHPERNHDWEVEGGDAGADS